MNDSNVFRPTPKDYDELVDFASLVFHNDFRALLPKLYDGHPELADAHYAVRQDDGRFGGLVGCFPLTMHVGGNALHIRGIGTVSVHPYARKKGYMRLLMDAAVRDAQQNGTDLMVLGGDRQRYAYFGFSPCGTLLNYALQLKSLRHLDAPGQTLQAVSLREQPQWLPACAALHESQHAFVERTDFMATATSWEAIPYALLLDGACVGCFSYIPHESSVIEVLVAEHISLRDTMMCILGQTGRDIQVLVQPAQTRLAASLSEISNGMDLHGNPYFNVLHYPRVIEAFLSLKGESVPLMDGTLVIDVWERGRYEVCVKNAQVSVRETSCVPDVSLGHLEMMQYLFSPFHVPAHPSALEHSWLPIPLFFPRPDEV